MPVLSSKAHIGCTQDAARDRWEPAKASLQAAAGLAADSGVRSPAYVWQLLSQRLLLEPLYPVAPASLDSYEVKS